MLRSSRRRESPPPERADGTDPPVIDALTGVRALAALWVVANHLGEAVYQLVPRLRVLEPLTVGGYLGVDVFFVLSGFIISYNYAGRLAPLDRRGYRAFLRARIARIYPAHLLALVVMALVIADSARSATPVNAGQDHSVVSFLGNALMLQAVPGMTPWNWPSWSVSTEFAAYLLFPLAAAAIVRIRRRTALVLATVVLAAEIAVLSVPMSTDLYMIALMWARIAGEFTVGCLLWAAWRHGVRAHGRWDLLAVAAAIAALALAWGAAGRPLSWFAVPFLALFVVAVAGSASVVQRVLASRPLQWGGRVSYSLYLLHAPVLAGLWVYYPPGLYVGRSLPARVGVIGLWLAALIGAAAVTYYFVEQPGRRLLRGRRSATGDAAVAAAPSGERAPTVSRT